MLIIFFLPAGPPGSGKKEAAAKIATQKEYIHLSVGELLRAEAAKDTDEGRELAAAIAGGSLAQWDIMMLLSQEIDGKQDAKGFVIDGFPRTKEQAEGFATTVGKTWGGGRWECHSRPKCYHPHS